MRFLVLLLGVAFASPGCAAKGAMPMAPAEPAAGEPAQFAPDEAVMGLDLLARPHHGGGAQGVADGRADEQAEDPFAEGGVGVDGPGDTRAHAEHGNVEE